MDRPAVDVNALRTRLARKFVSLADDVREGFEGFDAGLSAYAIELTTPPGQSTNGGKEALQHLCLVPQRPGHPGIIVATVSAVAKEAQLRSFEYVDAVHRARFRRAIDLTPRQWEQVLARAEEVFLGAAIAAYRAGPAKDLTLQKPRTNERIRRVALAAFVMVTAAALFVVWKVATGT